MIISYIRSYNNNQVSISVQKEMIERYCFEHDMEIDKSFCDYQKIKARLKNDAQKLLQIGYRERYRGESFFPQFDQLLMLIAAGEVKVILTDIKLRLSVSPYIDEFFDRLCMEHDVEVIEVGEYFPDTPTSAICVAIYHDTDKSKIRPVYCVKDIDDMYRAVHRNRWTATSVFIDMRRCKNSRYQFKNLLGSLDKYGVIVSKAMFSIDLKTGKLIQYLLAFRQNNVILYTLSLGEVLLSNDEGIMNRKFHIVAYDSFSRNQEETNFLQKIMKAFVNHKTDWSLHSYHYEGHRIQIDEEQKVLEEVIADQADWDGILVKSFRIINERTAKLERLLLRLDKDKFIYSMEEGVYLYGKKEKSVVLR